MVMVVEKVPAAWLVEIVTSLSHAVEGVTAVPLSSSPQRIFTVGFCPPVLFNTPVSTAVSREGWFTLIAPNPAGTILWASEIEWVMNRGQIKVQYFSMILTSIIWEEVWQIQYVCLILSTYLNFNTCKNTKNIKKVKLF